MVYGTSTMPLLVHTVGTYSILIRLIIRYSYPGTRTVSHTAVDEVMMMRGDIETSRQRG